MFFYCAFVERVVWRGRDGGDRERMREREGRKRRGKEESGSEERKRREEEKGGREKYKKHRKKRNACFTNRKNIYKFHLSNGLNAISGYNDIKDFFLCRFFCWFIRYKINTTDVPRTC